MRSLGGKIRVRIKRRWRGYSVGAVIQPPGALRKILLQDDVAEVVPEAAAAVEQVTTQETPGGTIVQVPTYPELTELVPSDMAAEITEKKKRKRKADAGDE